MSGRAAESPPPSESYLYTRLSPSQASHFAALTLRHLQERLEAAGRDVGIVAFGAHAFNLPFGLALAEARPGADHSELLSLFVKERYRRRGIGRELLARVEREAAQAGCRELRVLYETGRPYTQEIEAFLAAVGFPPAERYAVSCRCLFDRMREAPWLRSVALPRAFEIFSWSDLSSEERRALTESAAREPWYPEELSPFVREEAIEPLNSLGLRQGGAVVGWQINHRIAPDTIQYSLTFVRHDLQSLGLGVALMVESTRRQVFGADATLDKAFFRVPLAMTGMIQYIERRLRPYVDQMSDCMRAIKSLSSEARS